MTTTHEVSHSKRGLQNYMNKALAQVSSTSVQQRFVGNRLRLWTYDTEQYGRICSGIMKKWFSPTELNSTLWWSSFTSIWMTFGV